jgi:hypothetical protein
VWEQRENMAEHAGEGVGIVPAALRHRDFRLFWGGVVLSGLGSQVTDRGHGVADV